MSRFASFPTASVLAVAPGCVYPSIITGSVIVGRLVAGEIVLTPPPGILNVIVSIPGVALAQLIASRKLPDSAVGGRGHDRADTGQPCHPLRPTIQSIGG